MPPPDHRHPFPDEAHEDLAVWVEEAISDLADSFLLLGTLFELHDGARSDIGINQADLGDSLLLVGVLFELLDQAVLDLAAGATERAQLRADYDALAARVASLEAPASPPISTPTA
jgi:hypothetical protein